MTQWMKKGKGSTRQELKNALVKYGKSVPNHLQEGDMTEKSNLYVLLGDCMTGYDYLRIIRTDLWDKSNDIGECLELPWKIETVYINGFKEHLQKVLIGWKE